MKAKTKSSGGKLSRSEIVQTRLSPKVRFIAEILARQQRRTLSSLIECLIEDAANRCNIHLILSDKAQTNNYLFGERKYKMVSAKEALDKIWAAEEADRFAGLALFLPDLLTPEEQRLWELIVDTPYFWEHFEINIETKTGKVVDKEWWPVVSHRGLIREHLREHWPLLKDISEGKKPLEKLTKLNLPIGRSTDRPLEHHPIKKIIPSYDH